MSPALIILIVIAAIALVVVLLGISIYNKLVTLKNRYQNGFSQIEVQLKRRYDLIPNLVETAKAYMSHEREKHSKPSSPHATRPPASSRPPPKTPAAPKQWATSPVPSKPSAAPWADSSPSWNPTQTSKPTRT